MKNILLICFFWMGLCRWHQAHTQPMSMAGSFAPANISARYFSLTQGMPAQSVYGCVQDKRGFLWIATENGIARFDGFQFRRYGIQDGLPDLDVLNVCIDSTGTLWALPFQKPPVYYDASTDRFYMLPALAARDFRSYRAFILSQTELALSDIHGQIYVIDTRSREIIDSLNFQTLINQIVKLGVHRYGVLLSSTYIALRDHRLLFTCTLPIQVRYALCLGNIMYCGMDSSLFKIDIQTGKIILRKTMPFAIRQLDAAPDGVYATTLQGEIYLIHPGTLQIQRKIWQNASANEVYDPGNGLLWICTKEEGLIQLRHQYIQSVLQKSAYHVSNINCLFPVAGGWVAGNNRGECIFWSPQHVAMKSVTSRPNLDAWIRTIFYNEPYFLIVSQMGLYQLEAGKNPVQIFPQYYGFKVAEAIDDSTYWLGTHGYLFLCRFRHRHYDVRLAYAGKRVTAIAPVSAQECYVGSNDGLYHFEQGNMYQVNLHGKIGQQKVQTLVRDAHGWIWVAYGGDSLLAFQHQEIKCLMKTGEHFPGSIIKCLYADGKDLWVGTNNCLGKIQIHLLPQLHIETSFFSVNDGLAGEQVNDIKRYGQNLYVATSSGISYFPVSFTIPANDIPVYIMTLQTSRHEYADLSKPVQLSYKENFIRFNLSAVDYSGLPEIWFRYRLNNHRWIFTKTPVIYLNELPPGSYKLDVQAIRRDGLPSTITATSTFEIKAPFFVKPLFWFSLILFTLGITTFLFLRMYRKKQKQRLDRLEQEKKIMELEMQMFRAQISPHFIFNTLNAIKQMIYEKEIHEANAYLDKFSALLRTTLYTRQDDMIPLHQELTYLSQYLELEKLRFGNQFEYHMNISDQEEILNVIIPAMILQPVVENAVKHGIRKLKNRRGCIQIHISMHEQICRIEVMDNGPGISPQESSMKGKGLEITRKRAEWYHIRFDLQRITCNDQAFTVAIFEIPIQYTVSLCRPSIAIS